MPLSLIDLLALWDRGCAATPAWRPAVLLACADPNLSEEDAAALPIGERDARLLALREGAFGSHLSALSRCPACEEQVEFEVSTADIRVDAPQSSRPVLELECNGYALRLRLPTTADLCAIGGAASIEGARSALFARCLLGAEAKECPVAAEALPDAVVNAAIGRMAEADPQAEVHFALDCPACGQRWSAALDIGSYLWGEIRCRASAILYEVDALARAYGWSEREVLSLSPQRRRAYLELVGA